jgi:hypothetical protein
MLTAQMLTAQMLTAGMLTSTGARAQGDPLTAMKGDLRRLVSANEVYHAKNKRYAGATSALPGYRSTAGVTVTIVTATTTGWSATAVSTSVAGKSCVIFVGAVGTPPKTASAGLTGAEAVPVCDR